MKKKNAWKEWTDLSNSNITLGKFWRKDYYYYHVKDAIIARMELMLVKNFDC